MRMTKIKYNPEAPKECNEYDEHGMAGKVITYCRDYGSEMCRHICMYARQMDRKLGIEKKIKK